MAKPIITAHSFCFCVVVVVVAVVAFIYYFAQKY